MYFLSVILFAQLDTRLESFSAGFQKDRAQIDSGDLVLFLTGIVATFAVLWLVARWSERRVHNDSSLGLFWTLAKTHDVSWSDRWLLWKLARARHLAEPALLFLDPRLTSPQSAHHLAPHSTARLKSLRRKLFSGIDRTDEPEPSCPESSSPASSDVPALPSESNDSPFPHQHAATAKGLEKALNDLRALNLQDQPVRREETPTQVAKTIEEPSPTAEFPSTDAPALELYPWLGNDWDLTNSDE